MKKSILKGTMIVVIVGLIAKFVGLFFRIPLTSLIGEYGMGLFSFPMRFFLPIVALITSGPSIAIAKLISESDSNHKELYSYQVKKTAFRYMFILGCLVTLIMWVVGTVLLNTVWPKEVMFSFLMLLPAPIFLAFTAVYKGYYQGKQNMYPIAFQQFFDGIARLLFGLAMAVLLLPKGTEFAAAGGTFGTTAGAILGVVVYGVYYRKNEKNDYNEKVSKKIRHEILKRTYKIAVPVSISAMGATLIGLIDSLLIKNRLLYIGYSEQSMIKLNGVLSNVDTLMSIPLIIGAAISLNALPNIVVAKSKGIQYTQTRMRSMMIMLVSISLPAGIGLLIVGKRVFALLFRDMSTNHYLIEILSISVIFIMINAGLTSILQAMNRERLPVKNMYIGLIIKLVSSFILLSIPSINIHGSAISTLITYTVISILNFKGCLEEHFKVDYKYMIFVPLISTLLMGSVVYVISTLSTSVLITFVAIMVGAIVYGILMILFKVVDIKKIPLINKIK